MQIRLELTGNTSLLMHNERLSDPTDKIVKEIKSITDKKKDQTESDKETISKLEWYGGLYVDDKGDIIMPTKNIMKSLRNAATVTKSGTKLIRGLSPTDLFVPLMIEGSRHKDKLWNNPIHIDRRPVGIGKSRVIRTRPLFPIWGLVAGFELLEDVLNYSALVEIASLAGRAVGLCDARVLGHGRFDAKVSKVK